MGWRKTGWKRRNLTVAFDGLEWDEMLKDEVGK